MTIASPLVVRSSAPPAGLEPELRAFAASMPPAYRRAFSPELMALHARAAARRGNRAVSVALTSEQRNGGALCVVADDRPGLLWLINVALSAHELDVVRAHICCRRRADGRTEAVDLFWVRRCDTQLPSPLTASEVDELTLTIDRLLRSECAPALDPAALREEPDPPRAPAQVSFVVDSESGAAMLVIEAPDRPGLLLAITRALFEENVQIARAEVATLGKHALEMFYVLELDGGPVPIGRRAEIEAAARTAIAKARRGQR
jgi:[protein-PII] uridylyltransferase